MNARMVRSVSLVSLDRSWIDGWLLGDGSLHMNGYMKTARGTHSSSFEEYVRYVVSKLEQMGIFCGRIRKQERNGKDGTFYDYHMTTRSYSVLTEQFRRWYGKDKKRIPRDLVLDPVVLREWYLGDGCLDKVKGTPNLFMGGVSRRDVVFMVELLRKIFGMGVSYYGHVPKGKTKVGRDYQVSWQIYIPVDSSKQFFEYIGECPISCYTYKWPKGG